MTEKRRAALLDELRGLMIINVVAFHLCYDLVYLFGVNMPWYHTIYAYYWQQWMAGSLIFFAGISCRYTRSNIRRGVQTLLWGMVLTAVSLVIMPEQPIFFGILHFMGIAMLLFALLRPVLDKLTPVVGMCVSYVIHLITRGVPRGYIGLYPLAVKLPWALYQSKLLFPLGLPHAGFTAADYFPLLPWLFLFFAGAYLGVPMREGRLPGWVYEPHLPFMGWLGRKTLIIYLLHQPIIFGILWVLFGYIL